MFALRKIYETFPLNRIFSKILPLLMRKAPPPVFQYWNRLPNELKLIVLSYSLEEARVVEGVDKSLSYNFLDRLVRLGDRELVRLGQEIYYQSNTFVLALTRHGESISIPCPLLGVWITRLSLPVVVDIYRLTRYPLNAGIASERLDDFESNRNMLTWFMQRKNSVSKYPRVHSKYDDYRIASRKRWVKHFPNLQHLEIRIFFVDRLRCITEFGRHCYGNLVPIIKTRLCDWEMCVAAQNTSFEVYCEGCHQHHLSTWIHGNNQAMTRLIALPKVACGCEERLRAVFQVMAKSTA